MHVSTTCACSVARVFAGSCPAIFPTAPGGGMLPRSTLMPPLGLKGRSAVLTTGCPGVSTALATYLWNKALEILGAGVTSVFFFAQPVAGALLGWLLLHEPIGVNFFVGGPLILAALGLALDPEPAA